MACQMPYNEVKIKEMYPELELTSEFDFSLEIS
jgi:hypothetical protein